MKTYGKTTWFLYLMIKNKMFHLLNTVMIFYKITISHKVSPLSMVLNIMMVALPSLNVLNHLVVWLEERPKRHRYFAKIVDGKSKSDGLAGVVKSFA